MKHFEDIPGKLPVIEISETRLELVHRNKLQRCIIQRSLGEDARNSNAVYEWAQQNLEHISAIIDAPEHEDIRVLARNGEYEEAAAKVISLLHLDVAPQ